ncbi:MAG: tyrosine-type recombinase/integrase [Gammaproteobacteria bacterium]
MHVGELADVAERNWHRMRVLLEAARAAGSSEQFTVESTTWLRVDGASHPQAHPRILPVDADGNPVGDRLDMVIEEEDAFWGFAVVEVLRHTGIRIEELLELTQLDLHTYHHPDPAVGTVLLLHVNPSKQDRERMVVIPPELAAVFAAMARRVRAAVGSTDAALPALVAYDYGECVNSEPLPFLFQRTAGRGLKGTTRPMHKTYVARVLNKVVAAADLRGPDGTLLDYTAHDFRRIFATDALAAGLPPHLIQKLMGHASLATTEAYAAVFPDDVIRAHRAFIHNRRSLRPTDEYRDVTAAEWDEFEQHFAKRKIAIGDCLRAYGTNCVHEYACEQCKLARPDPDAQPRLERTRDGLVEQLDEARQRGWLGEIERLEHILAAVDDKLDEIGRATRRLSVVVLTVPPARRAELST